MTVVNAMKFDFYRGALVCDEQTTFGDNRYAYLSDKIKPLIPPEVMHETGMTAAYGGSGTQSVAAEVVKKTHQEFMDVYADMKYSAQKRFPFRTIEEVAHFAMKKLLEVKHQHLNDKLYSSFHFNLDDFNQGYYEIDGERIEIKQQNIVDKATDYITWKDYNPEVDAIFKNSAIVAGFDPTSGFEIYTLSLMDNECFFCGGPYESIGSGSDIATISLNDFINTKVLSARRTKIDPLEGVIELIRSTNACARRNYGVGGYFNIVIIDGTKKGQDTYKEIMDHSARLASEIVFACDFHMINMDDGFKLIDDLIFQDKSFEEVEDEFCAKSVDLKKMNLLLRGYKINRIFNGKQDRNGCNTCEKR
ncbi:MAG: hypothetical protein LWY06_13210 [Firmicutes bacterium]|nr:hypothetical protein [Bacillota bacterium]